MTTSEHHEKGSPNFILHNNDQRRFTNSLERGIHNSKSKMFSLIKRSSVTRPLYSISTIASNSSIRQFSQSQSRKGGHHEEELSPDEHLGANGPYKFFLISIPLVTSVLYLDGKYRDSHDDKSWFAQFLTYRTKESLETDQEEYNQRIEKDKEFREVLYFYDEPRKFGRTGGTTAVPRGSPFNSVPGDSWIDVDNLEPRRGKGKSIFD